MSSLVQVAGPTTLLRRALVASLTAAALLTLAMVAPAAAEDPAPVYTRVALWQVERAHWGDFVEFFTKYDQPVMEKLMADGVILEWGLDAESLHHPEGYTHATWFSATTMAGLEKALEAYDAFYEKLPKQEQTASDAEFAAMITKHRDYLMRNVVLRSRAGDIKGAYYLASFGRVKMGHGQDYRSYWDHRVLPVYEKLFADGTIVAYGLAVEEVNTEPPGGRESWCMPKNADALDTVKAAFDASWDAMADEEQRARWQSIVSIMEEGSYRESMSKNVMGRQSNR